jgi:hypothetical protein
MQLARDTAESRAAALHEALTEVMELINSYVLVRNTEDDAEPGWAMRQLPMILTLKKAQSLLDAARQEPAKGTG